MFVIAKVRDQVVASFFRGSFGTKKLRAHVVVDPKDTRALPRETPHAFRANQSCSTCNDDRAHHGDSVAACHSPIIHVTSPATGFTRAAGNCGSPASTRSISSGLFDAPTRNKICPA